VITGRRAYALGIVCCLVGAAALLFAVGQPWGHVVLDHGAGAPTSQQELTGSDIAGALTGPGLVGLAGVAGIVAARGRLRRVVGLVVLGAGAAAAVLAIVATARDRLADAAVAAAPGAVASSVSQTAWPWVAAVGAIVMAVGGGLAAAGGAPGGGLSARHEAPTASQPAAADPWAALDRGDDPTVDPTDEAPGGAA
jgi:hypothetical protein